MEIFKFLSKILLFYFTKFLIVYSIKIRLFLLHMVHYEWIMLASIMQPTVTIK